MRKIYDKEFKKKAVQLSYDRTNTSELDREFGITTTQFGYATIKEFNNQINYKNLV